MSYVISINQNFARTLDEQAALRLAELSGTFAAFKYDSQGLPTRQEPRMFNVDHPFDWHTFGLFVGMFQPPGRLLDWAIDDVCEFVRICHFFIKCMKISRGTASEFLFRGSVRRFSPQATHAMCCSA